MSVNLGRVAYVEKGAYDGGTTYQKKDVVSYNNGSYVYIADVSAAGIVPTDTAYWQPMINPEAMNRATEAANKAAEAATAAVPNLRKELDGKAPAILVDATGDMVHITDGAESMPVQSLVTHIAPVQSGSGDPSPDNVRPISGWDSVTAQRAGKNIVENTTLTFKTTYYHYFAIKLKPGTYTMTATVESADTDKTQSTAYFYIRNAEKVEEQGRMIFNRGERESHTLTLPDGAGFILFCASTNSSNSSGDTCTWTDIQLECTGAATDFEPYNGQTLTTELPETVYGGVLDWTTGLMTVTHKKETITRMSATHSNAGEGYLAASVSKPDMKSDSRDNGLCETMKSVRSQVGATSNCIVFGASNQTLYIAISTELAGTTRDSLNAYLAENPLTVVYPLAEPYTIQLTPQQLETLKGTNNIWSDAGQTEVTYAADTKLYIDGKIAAIAAAIV